MGSDSALSEDFSIDGRGNGIWRRALPAATPDYDIVTKRFHVGPERFSQLRKLIAPLQKRVAAIRKSCPPTERIDHKVRIRWRWEGADGDLSFIFVCLNDWEQGETYAMIEQLPNMVRAWAEPMPIAERYPVIGPR